MRDENLIRLCKSLAVEMSVIDFPNLWKLDRNRREWYEELTTRDAWLMMQRDGKRIHISADHPREMERVYNAPSITVSADRTPEAIARDIVTRLLPNARAYFQTCRAETIRVKERQQAHQLLLHSLKEFTTWKQTDSDKTRTQWRGNKARADVYSNFISELRIDSPTIEQTITILKILKG